MMGGTSRREVILASALTVFRSPQLAFFHLGPDEWLLYWHVQPYASHRRKHQIQRGTQLSLFNQAELEQVAGAEMTQPFLEAHSLS
jgi:hypothetical protein